jgi:hypothetical protein
LRDFQIFIFSLFSDCFWVKAQNWREKFISLERNAEEESRGKLFEVFCFVWIESFWKSNRGKSLFEAWKLHTGFTQNQFFVYFYDEKCDGNLVPKLTS